MGAIVCAIRGGPSSQSTIARAIALAQETHLPLHFAYIVDLSFLSRTASSRVSTISEQMHQMGEAILLTAESTANAAGVMARGAVRHVIVDKEIVTRCCELGATYLVLGQPRGADEKNVFSPDQLAAFRDRVEREIKITVLLPEGDAL